MFDGLKEEITAVKMRDPAARGTLEVITCYPGFWAIIFQRIAHWFWIKNLPFWGRFVSHLSRFLTGIEIHPGAQIGKRVFIDHGMGVVIGETAIVGNDVLIYQGVVLGGTSLSKGKRHPTVEDGVVVGSGAKVLGNITLGKSSKIGAGSVVLRDVPPGTTAVGVPSRIVQEKRNCVMSLDHDLPDPVTEAVDLLLKRQKTLEDQVELLNKKLNIQSKHLEKNPEIEEIFNEY
ncbi:MAG: serine O-acetyltransferase [archaeon]|nr:serine O-acetyltransferase [archaeon]